MSFIPRQGTVDEVSERLRQRRERYGLSYYSFFDPGDEQIEVLAELLCELAP